MVLICNQKNSDAFMIAVYCAYMWLLLKKGFGDKQVWCYMQEHAATLVQLLQKSMGFQEKFQYIYRMAYERHFILH